MKYILLIFTLITVSTINLLAQSGGPPMITDDPGTPDIGTWEVNFAFSSDFNKSEKEFEAPLLDINYGFNERTQLKLEFPWLFTKNISDEYQNRFGDVTLGVKYRFFDEEKSGFALSIYPQITFITESDIKCEYLLPLQIEKSFGKVVLGMDLRYEFIESNNDVIQNGFLLGVGLSENMAVMSEFVYWGNAKKFDDVEGVLNFGLKYHTSDLFSLMTSVGTGIISPDKDSRITFISFLGLQMNI